MMRVRVPVRCIQPGDRVYMNNAVVTVKRIVLDASKDPVAYMTRAYGSEGLIEALWDTDGYIETEEVFGDPASRYIFFVPAGDMEIVAASGYEVAERVAEALDPFDSQVRAHVARTFCRECGERECRRHQ